MKITERLARHINSVAPLTAYYLGRTVAGVLVYTLSLLILLGLMLLVWALWQVM